MRAEGEVYEVQEKRRVTYGQEPVETGKDDVLQSDQKGKAENQRQCEGNG